MTFFILLALLEAGPAVEISARPQPVVESGTIDSADIVEAC